MTELTIINTPAIPDPIIALLQAEGMAVDPDRFAALTPDEHFAQGVKAFKASALAAVLAGAHFVAAMDAAKASNTTLYGQNFIKNEAERLGIGRQSIYNMIDVYKLFVRSPSEIVHALRQLEYSKLLQLKHFDSDDLTRLAEGQEVYGVTLEAAQTYSLRELQAVINSHRTEIKTLKQRILDAERKLAVEAKTAADLWSENQALKALPPERASFTTMRQQLFDDMEAAAGIVARARKTYEALKNLSPEVEAEARDSVINPLLHTLSVLHGGAALIAQDCYQRWPYINPEIPVNAPDTERMTHAEFWAAAQSAKYQTDLTDKYLEAYNKLKVKAEKKPKPDKKAKKSKPEAL